MASLPIPAFGPTTEMTRSAGNRFLEVLRAADPSRTVVGVWNTAELATHVALIAELYPILLGGGASPVKDHLRMAAYWDRALAEDTMRDPVAAADRIERCLDAYMERISEVNWHEEVVWHGGVRIPAFALTAVLLNEFMIHGRDVATAHGQEWPISQAEAIASFEGHLPILPYYVNENAIRTLNATFALRLSGTQSIFVTVASGKIQITADEPERIDCRVTSDPLTYLLVGYGRIGQWRPILTGKIRATGRKPWLGLKFASLFHSV